MKKVNVWGGLVRLAVLAAALAASGKNSTSGAIPEGALNPTLNLDQPGLTPWQKTVARAVQVYGMCT
jgi:hypothetical protein